MSGFTFITERQIKKNFETLSHIAFGKAKAVMFESHYGIFLILRGTKRNIEINLHGQKAVWNDYKILSCLHALQFRMFENYITSDLLPVPAQ